MVNVMRRVVRVLIALPVLLLTAGGSVRAQQPGSPAPGNGVPLEVPVCIDRIRDALAHPPAETLKGLDQPTFRLMVLERQRIDQIMEQITFEGGGGPEVSGGRSNYDMQQLLFPPVDNPLVQPYAPFTTGQVATLAAEGVAEKLTVALARRFREARHQEAEREARDEVMRALAAFYAAHPEAPRP
jgi:hypothetical protein